MYKEQGELEKCAATALEAVELGRENRADYKLIAKAFSRCALAYKEMEVSVSGCWGAGEGVVMSEERPAGQRRAFCADDFCLRPMRAKHHLNRLFLSSLSR